MEEKVPCVSAATLLHENWRRKLQDLGYLRPMANDDDRVWQQMTFEHFVDLVRKEQLYVKAYGEYSDYDEMKLREFVVPHLEQDFREDSNIKEELQSAYDNFEKRIFISCWYSSPDLSDVVFKIYAKGNSGIAIGTRVGILREQMYQAQRDYNNVAGGEKKIRNIVCANVQYVPQKYMEREELFEPAQVYAPIFMKGLQFKMDNEFRVCLEKNAPEELRYNSPDNLVKTNKKLSEYAEQIEKVDGKGLTEKIKEIEKDYEEYDRKLREKYCEDFLPICPPSLIKFIAIKDDSWFQKLGEDNIRSLFEKWFDIKMELNKSYRTSGFLVFDVIEIGGEKHV